MSETETLPPPAPAMSKARAWWTGLRVASLSASVVPVLVGTAAARPGHLNHPLAFVAALLASMLIQTGTNFSNDVFDYRSGADSASRLGPARLILSGAITPREALLAAGAAFGAAALLGLYLITVGGWPILIIGVASIVAGVVYTGGPWPVGYHGLGDLFTFVFFGLAGVIGSAYLQILTVTPVVVLAALPVGFLITAILVVNNLRDIATDRAVGKMTLAVRLGPGATRGEYGALVGLSYLVPLALVVAGRSPAVFLPLLTLPLAVRAVDRIRRLQGPALNALLRGTGQLNLVFGVLLAAGLWLS